MTQDGRPTRTERALLASIPRPIRQRAVRVFLRSVERVLLPVGVKTRSLSARCCCAGRGRGVRGGRSPLLLEKTG